jgi:DNA repair protein RadC
MTYFDFTGGINGTVLDPKLVFQSALKANVSSVILAYNYPSGNIFPILEDISITKKLIYNFIPQEYKYQTLPPCLNCLLL